MGLYPWPEQRAQDSCYPQRLLLRSHKVEAGIEPCEATASLSQMGSCAAAAPSQFLSISSSSSSKFSLQSADHGFGISRKNWNWNRNWGDPDGNGRRKKKKNLGLSVKAYKRIPMETAGAYQLVDDKTGDKVIIWGGADDDNRSHRQQVLSWKPKPNPQQEDEAPGIGGGDAIGANAAAAALPVAEGGSLRSFARLKAPKVKDLIQKKSSKAGNTVADASRKMVAGRLGSERNDDKIRDKETKKLPVTVIKRRQDVEDAAAPEYVHVPAPRAASGLRGWSRAAASVQSNDDIFYPKHQRKMSVDSGFFSRKTFEELGCTGDMIESLRSLSFLRPSHIQVMQYANGPPL